VSFGNIGRAARRDPHGVRRIASPSSPEGVCSCWPCRALSSSWLCSRGRRAGDESRARLGIAYPHLPVIGGLALGSSALRTRGGPGSHLSLHFCLRSSTLRPSTRAAQPARRTWAPSLVASAVVVTRVRGRRGGHSLPRHPVAVASRRAIVAAADAIAAAAIAPPGRPRRIVSVLEGESPLNDATALTSSSIAIRWAVGGRSRRPPASGPFVGRHPGRPGDRPRGGLDHREDPRRASRTRRRDHDSLLTPYAAFLPARSSARPG